MAVSMRASVLFAAAVMPAFASQWYIDEKFSDSACATRTDRNVFSMETYFSMAQATNGCMATGGASMKQTCVGPTMQIEVFTSADCSGTATSTSTTGNVCEEDEDNAGTYTKMSCGALPAGMTAITVTTFAAANCSGTETVMQMGQEFGACNPDSATEWEKLTSTSTGITSDKYAAAGCSGTPASTETMECGTCHHEMNMIIACAGLGATAGNAAAVAPSMAAVLALTGSMLFGA